MSGILKPKIEVLPDAQRKILPELKGATDLGFVLYGGTAIALRLGHRALVDFDFFADRALDRRALEGKLPFPSEPPKSRFRFLRAFESGG